LTWLPRQRPGGEAAKKAIGNMLFPELRSYERSERDRLLREAIKTPLDLWRTAGL
jgi:hypothetical protein